MVGLVPVYAVRLGADPATTGTLLAFSFFVIIVGTLVSGWLSDRLGRRKILLVIGSVAWIPLYLLMTQITTVTQLMLLTGAVWFFGGSALAICNTLTGLSAGDSERGKVFGLISLSVGVAGFISGIVSGRIVDQWGFPALFVSLTLVAALMVILALFVEDKHTKRETTRAGTSAVQPPGLGRAFYLVLLANLFAQLTLFVNNLARPLAMTALDFDATAISGVIAVSSAVTMPLPLLIGSLSDRLGRRTFLVLCYSAGIIGLLLLIPAAALWQFWLSASAVAFIMASGGVAQALVADLVPPHAMGRGISLFNTTTWIAGLIGYGGAGYIIQATGMNTALVMAALMPLIAIGFLSRLRRPGPVPNPV
jgi:MFS family permease